MGMRIGMRDRRGWMMREKERGRGKGEGKVVSRDKS